MSIQVTGAGLLSLSADFRDRSKADTVLAAGYIRADGRPAYTAFYEALLAARGIEPAPTVSRGLGDGPAIYVACLASYNAGRLVGDWLDLSDAPDAEDIKAAIAEVIATSPAPDAEEYAIHDSQCLPGILGRSEWPDIDALAQYCEIWADLPAGEDEGYRLLCDDAGQVLTEVEFRDRFYGFYDSPEAFAAELWEDRVPEDLEGFINWEAVWRSLDSDGYGATYVDGRGYMISTGG